MDQLLLRIRSARITTDAEADMNVHWVQTSFLGSYFIQPFRFLAHLNPGIFFSHCMVVEGLDIPGLHDDWSNLLRGQVELEKYRFMTNFTSAWNLSISFI